MTAPPRPDVVNWNDIISTPGEPDWSQGPAGPAGPPGPQGLIGPPGANGAEGIQGDPGLTGPGWKTAQTAPVDGQATGDVLGTIWYDSVTGQFWTLVNTTPYTWRYDGVVVGAQGIAGPQGPTGPQGVPGATGNTGPAGPQGVQGPVGPGVAPGGATGTILTKASATDYATQWSASLGTSQITDGAVTSAKILDGTIAAGDMAAGAAASNVGALGGVLGGTLPNPTMAAGAAATNVGTLGGALTGTLPNPGLATGSVTTTQIADGTIATADLADRSVTNIKLGTDTARLNLLTNGGFEIWQRGNGPFTSGYTADRWNLQPVSGSTASITRQSGGSGGGYRAGVVYTHVASGYVQVLQVVGNDQPLQGLTISLAVRVLSSTPNAIRAMIYDSVGSSRFSAYHSGSGAVETLTLTATFDPATTSIQVGFHITNASCTVYVDSAMLVVGSVPADYAPLHPADDLARCLRYYFVWPVNTYVGTGYWSTATGARTLLPFPVIPAVVPTLTAISPTAFTYNDAVAVTAFSFGSSSLRSAIGYGTVSGQTAGQGHYLSTGGSGGSSITGEANP